MVLGLDTRYLDGFVERGEIFDLEKSLRCANDRLHSGSGSGNDALGWLNLPLSTSAADLKAIEQLADRIRSQADILLVVGIGGSYLGARAALEFLGPQKLGAPRILFVGNDISSAHITQTLAQCEGQDVAVNIISKSGSTTEPAIAFRIVLDYMQKRYGDAVRERIYCTTDPAKGKLRELCEQRGYANLPIPSDIGGRYSVLTAVGLLPIAAAGYSIRSMIEGAARASELFAAPNMRDNICWQYAAIRHILQQKGRRVELFASYEPHHAMLSQWLIQLFGESQGKDGKGLLPVSAQFTTDLHSLGQFIQQGSRILFETVLMVQNPRCDIEVPSFSQNFDSLGYLQGRKLSEINRIAMNATAQAHLLGGTPTVLLNLENQDEYHLGYLFYFFEKACALGGYLMGVNPFDQPGVEQYKRNMFELLGRPGY